MMPAAVLDAPDDSVVSVNGVWKSCRDLAVLKNVSMKFTFCSVRTGPGNRPWSA
jgi:hypothetical protein